MNLFTKFTSPQIELLKWIAIIAMTIDHIGYIFFPDDITLRIVGRLAFPIFGFILVHNYLFFTKCKNEFIKRLFIFSLISQPFYMLLFPEKLNIFILLSFSLLFIKKIEDSLQYENFISYAIKDGNIINSLLIIFIPFFIFYFHNNLDYGLLGFLLIISIFLTFKKIIWIPMFLFFLFLLNLNSTIEYMYATLFFIPFIFLIKFLNKLKINRTNSLFFYIFYPAHISILFILSFVIL